MIRPANSFTRIVSTMAVLFAVSCAALAQEAARPDRGNTLNRNYLVSDVENINLQNGNVQLTIPLASLPPIAGGKLSWTVSAHYNSKLWDVLREQIDQPDLQWAPYVVDLLGTGGGWTIGGQYVMEFRNSNNDFSRTWYSENSGLPQWELHLLNNFAWWKIVLRFPDGSEHEFRPLDAGTSYTGSEDFLRGYFNTIPDGSAARRYYAVDGSYMFASITSPTSWTVYMPDGTLIIQSPDGVQRVQDTNGNKIKIFTDANGTHYQDEQTGREVRITYDPAANGGLGRYRVFYATVGAAQQFVDVNMGSTTVTGKTYPVSDWDFGSEQECQRDTELQSQLHVVREIVLPQTEPGQTRKFAFAYNSDTTESTSNFVNWFCGGGFQNYTRNASIGWGELSRMIAPPGTIANAAFTDYKYSLNNTHMLMFNVDDIAMQSITEKKLTHDGVTDTWTYAISDGSGSVVSPDGQNITEQRYCSMSGPGCTNEKSGLAYRTRRPFMMIERKWTHLVFSGANLIAPGGTIGLNPVVDVEYTTLLDAGNNPLKMSAKKFQYDFNGNVTQVTEYDWFDPALVSRDSVGVPTGVPGSATVLRVTNTSYYNQAVGSTSGNVYAKRSIPGGTPLILNAVKESTRGPSIFQYSYDNQVYGVAPTAGNLTTTKAWVDLESKWVTATNTYGAHGNLATASDGRGKVTQYFYDDSTKALPTRVVVDPQNSTGTQSTTTAYDYSTGLITSQTDANGQVFTIDYTNQLLGTADPFGRPGVTKAPTINIGGTNHRRRMTSTYLDVSRQVIVAADLNAENDKVLKTRQTVDMLGRPVLTEQTEDGTNYTVSSRNAYLDMGRVTLMSSQMRSSPSSTDSWQRVTKDNAGRVTEVSTFAGATQPAWTGTGGVHTGSVITAYDANFTTVTDQTGKARRSMIDAAGRLRRVDEPDANGNLGSTAAPVQSTTYAYSVLDALTTVTQGSQTRTFTYDSLKRLRSAANPESGTTSYQYDDSGNLLVKTDARGASIHFEYDGINRLTRRWYNGSSSIAQTTHNVPALPAGVGTSEEAKFFYDTQALPGGAPSYSRGASVGRLVALTLGTGSNGDYFAYDALGRATLKIQQMGTVNYNVSATYQLSGAVGTLTYPSGHTITNSVDQSGRLSSFSGNLGDGTTRTYSSGIIYGPIGSLAKEQFGTTTPIYNKLFYNSRGQLAEIRESTSYTGPTDTTWDRGAIINNYSSGCTGICSGSSMADNNGTLKKQEIHIPGQTMRWQEFSYDSLNRLSSAREVLNGGAEQWKQAFTYDRWGNRTINTGVTYGTGINNKPFNVNTTNNRLEVPGGQSGVMQYDAAGNLTNDTYTGAGNRTYDSDNRITSAHGGNNQAQLYTYDASGQRIKRTVDGVVTWQVYGIGGELLAEYPANGATTSPQKEYGYRNGQLLISAAPTGGGGGVSETNVTWTNPVGVSITGNTITRTAAGDAWNSGASSTQMIASGDGYAEFTAAETNKRRSFGLTTSTTVTGMHLVTYGIHLGDDGSITIHEGVAVYGVFGTYTTGDKLRVAIEGGVVKYRKNGTLLRTSTLAPTYPLYAGGAPFNNGATVSSAVITAGPQNVTWTNPVGVSITGNSITRTAAGDAWNSGARSTQTIASGDGYAEFTAAETNKRRSFGLTTSTTVTGMQHVTYAIHLGDDGSITVHEGLSVYGVFGTYTTGDKLRIAIESGVVKYRKNGTLLRTSTLAPTYPLYVGGAPFNNGATVSSAIIGSGSGGGAAGQTLWLVSDQLGTPRMVFDQTGSLANVKRHDYLPFGEEIFAPTGGRSAAQGYGTADGVRQQFTSYERDVETGLDYAQARYYSNIQGRFTSVDPLRGSGIQWHPQSWNRYSYCLNNPLLFVDPSGLIWLTKDWKNFQWVDDADYVAEEWEGYEEVPNNTVVFFSNAWGSYDGKYEELRGGYVKLKADGTLAKADPGVSEAEPDEQPEDKSWDLPVNPTKLLVATANYVIAGKKTAGVIVKLGAALGVEIGTGGLGTKPAIVLGAWGVWDLMGAAAAFNRARQQSSEALNEKWSDASLKNLWGLAPYGQGYDDPGEPGVIEFWKHKLKTWYHNPIEFISEIASGTP
jgi:RHS repeat-associated protein